MNKYKLSRYLVFTKNTISLKYHIVYSTLSNKILALDKNVRSNIDGVNNEDTINLINILEERNILKFVNLYLAPLHSWGNDAHEKAMSRENFQNLKQMFY